MRKFLPITLATCMLAAVTARADTITAFDISGNYTTPSSGTFSGTLTLDVTTGAVDSVDITVPTVGEFDQFPQVYPLHSNVEFEADDAGGDTLDLYITASSGSFEGFSGGTVYGNLIDLIRGGLLTGLTGDVTAPAAAVATPEPSSLVLLAGALGCLGLAARRARRLP